jgi:hypothetical protein
MTFPSRALPWLRLRPGRGRLLCLVVLPRPLVRSGRFTRELAFVASRRAPHLRRLSVLRPLDDGPRPDGAPRAA